MASRPALKLSRDFVAVRVNWSWWGQTRKVAEHVKTRMAAAVQADPDSVSAGKRIYSSKIPSVSKVNALRSAVKSYVESVTNPGLADGWYFLPRTDLDAFEQQMEAFRAQLPPLAAAVQADRQVIIDEAKLRLASAFDPANYPADLALLFSLTW